MMAQAMEPNKNPAFGNAVSWHPEKNGFSVQGDGILSIKNGPSDHLSVQGVINLLGNDIRQLYEEIGMLRDRLAPVLSERSTPNAQRLATPVECKMAAELQEIYSVVQNARELVSITMSQVDI